MLALIDSRLMRALTALGLSGLAAASLLGLAQPAQAAVALKCGAAITRSVTLSQNVNCTKNSADDGLTVAAAGVTINLNGHKILGPGDSKDTGGIVANGHNNVTIENGTITNFWYDVTVSGTSTSKLRGLRIRNLTITENTLGDQNYGIFGSYLYKASMTGLTIKNAYEGVELDNSQHCTVTGSHLTSPYTGLVDSHGTDNTWSHTSISGVNEAGISVSDDTGAVITADAIAGGEYGVQDFGSTDTLVSRNKLEDLFVGIDVAGAQLWATFSDNSGTGDLYGIYAAGPVDESFVGNVFSNGQYGIQVDYPKDVTLKLNTTNSNSEAGIYVSTNGTTTGYSATLSHNTADKNQFGLYSQIHRTGGSNRAVGNAVVNCHNVSCLKG